MEGVLKEETGYAGLGEREYKSLTDRILQYQRLRVQVLGFTVLAVAALAALPQKLSLASGTAFSIDYVLLVCAYSPYIVLIPSCLLTSLLSRHITYIGSYILVFHEAKPGLPSWEYTSFIKLLRQYPAGFRPSTKIAFSLSYIFLGLFSFLFCYFVGREAMPEGLRESPVTSWAVSVTHSVLANVLNVALLILLAAIIRTILLATYRLDKMREYIHSWLELGREVWGLREKTLTHLEQCLAKESKSSEDAERASSK